MSTIKVDGIRSNSATSDAITLASDGTCTANITNNLSNRNLIINGAMQVSQRGTSFADSANNSYTLDRFLIQNSSGTPAFTVTQDTDAPHGFNNSLKVACTTADASPAAGSFSRIRHTIEAQNLQPLAKGTSSAKAQTLSFYVKTNKTGVYTVFIFDDDNTRMMSASYTVSDTNWNRYTISIPADTTGAMANDTGAGYVIHWGLSLGSNRTSGSLASTWAAYSTANEHVGNVNFADNTSNVWAITGVQLEVGSVATDFEHKSYADELQRCKRYYVEMGRSTVSNETGYVLNGLQAYGNSALYGTLAQLPVTMRAKPTCTVVGSIKFSDKAGSNAHNPTNTLTVNHTSTNYIATSGASFSSSHFIQGGFAVTYAHPDGTNYIKVDAEL